MTDELVERIARAIASETLSLAFMEPHPLEGSLTARCRDEDRKTAFRLARACLSAIEAEGLVIVPREPTEEMTFAGNHAVPTPAGIARTTIEQRHLRRVWFAMLTAALKEGK